MSELALFENTDLKQKLVHASLGACLFILVSLPQVYSGTNTKFIPTVIEQCPTPEGKFLHSALFFVLNFLVMKYMAKYNYLNMGNLSDGLLAKYAFMGTLLFFLISSSDTYRLTHRLYDGLSNPLGCPNLSGVLVHGLVFLAILVLVMYFPRDNTQ